jgi:hypothetical protein
MMSMMALLHLPGSQYFHQADLNIHSSIRTGHNHWTIVLSVHHNAEVSLPIRRDVIHVLVHKLKPLPSYVNGLGRYHIANRDATGWGLLGDQMIR